MKIQNNLRGSGIAVPIFSLRSNNSFGIGEYADLKILADWSSHVGIKMIQTLPVNDTTNSHTNQDSYPYSPISVFALHPIYLNIPMMGKLTAAEQARYDKEQKQFNALSYADYQAVYDAKTYYFKQLYSREWGALCAGDRYKAFLRKNSDWLLPYAEFMSKRDGEPKTYYHYLQYHADQQLREAVDYARLLGVGMKGDIPIGVDPYSVEVATHPELFNTNASAGAPPDAFDMKGQNWGFPTYNWDEMAKDGYSWWQRRLKKMEDYFDAYRIDHILGMFRIWQMRKSDVWGLCGHFVPALPYTLQELWDKGVKLDADRMTLPYIRSNFIDEALGQDKDYILSRFMLTDDGYVYYFREEFNTQRKVYDYMHSEAAAELSAEDRTRIINATFRLLSEVLFVRDQNDENLLHPRVLMTESFSFRDLYDDQKAVLGGIYHDYFYCRHNEFWRESGMKKLPALVSATSMLCCGEDLGMVPACVPEVMHELNILSLEIERMPKDPSVEFGDPLKAPYMSVCTTGTHDTNPLRAWWEEDRERTQRYYNNVLGMSGEAPMTLTTGLAEMIIMRHLSSPAMWVILPLQDWFALDNTVRNPDAHAERINDPSNPHNFWCYRMHINLEELVRQHDFKQHVRNLCRRAK